MNVVHLFWSSSRTQKFIVTFSGFVVALQIYNKLNKKKVNDKNENLTYKNKHFPKIGSVIGHVNSLHVYPIKSCQGITIKSTKFNMDGVLYDRLIMVVNPRLIPITQRMIPKLALIHVEIISNNDTDILSLSLPNEYNYEKLNLNLKLIEQSNGALNNIDLHTVKAKCKDCGDKAAEWLNNALSIITGKTKKNNRFVVIENGEARKIQDSLLRLLMDDCKTYDSTRLSDLAPVTFVSTASLKSLNEKIGTHKSIPIDRFRSNIVFKPINDNYAFLEDHISMLQIGSIPFRRIAPTFRCIMPSVNQQTGETQFFKSRKTCEPVNTLRRTRSTLRYGVTGLLPPEMGGTKGLAPLFGIYLGFVSADVTDIENKTIHEGDQVIVLKYKKDAYGFINQFLMKIERYFGYYTLE